MTATNEQFDVRIDVRPPDASHRITAIHFPPQRNDGPCECSCGWFGKASAFAAHRPAPTRPAEAPGPRVALAVSGTCGVDVCDRPATVKGWCDAHYNRWRANGDMCSPIGVSRGRAGSLRIQATR